jgi:hypothetical protein
MGQHRTHHPWTDGSKQAGTEASRVRRVAASKQASQHVVSSANEHGRGRTSEAALLALLGWRVRQWWRGGGVACGQRRTMGASSSVLRPHAAPSSRSSSARSNCPERSSISAARAPNHATTARRSNGRAVATSVATSASAAAAASSPPPVPPAPPLLSNGAEGAPSRPWSPPLTAAELPSDRVPTASRGSLSTSPTTSAMSCA